MRYLHLLSWVASTAWSIEAVKAQTILGVLMSRAFGDQHADQDEAQAKRSWHDADDETPEQRAARLEAAEQRAISDRGGIAIVSVTGVIAPRIHDIQSSSLGGPNTSAEGIAARVSKAAADSNVSGIIIDVDSPGGNVSGLTEAAAIIRAASAQKPVVAIANHWAASAAYHLASGAGELVVSPSGEVGSIGVFAYHQDISAALEKRGVKPTLIKAGAHKAETHPAFPLSEDAAAYLQAAVDASYATMIDDIAKGRGVAEAKVRDGFGRGRMVAAAEAVQRGMADRIGTLAGEIERMQRGLKSGRKSTEDRRRRLAVA